MAITNPLDPARIGAKPAVPAIAAPPLKKPLVQTAAVTGAPGLPAPAPALVKPAIAKPETSGGFARGLFDTAAVVNDVMKAVPKGIADGTNRAFVGIRNIAREGVGKAPVQPMEFNYSATQDKLAQTRAANAAPAKPAVAAPAFPSIRFADTDSAPRGFYKTAETRPTPTASNVNNPPLAAPTTFMTGDGRTGTLPAGISMRVGANGVREFSGTGQTVADATAAMGNRAPGGVTTQSGISAPTFAPLGRSQVASTYGLSVNDPRLDEQQAGIARPNVALRGPDAMAEQYNAREDREARNKQLGDIDTALFQLRGKNDPDSLRAFTALTQTRAGLVGGGESLSADAIQGREGRNNAFGIAGLQEAGQSSRADGARESAERIAAMEDATTREGIAAEIARPRYDQDRAGNMMQISGTLARPVLDENGRVFQGPVTKANGEITAAMQYQALNDQLDTMMQNPPMGGDVPARTVYDQSVAALKQQIAHLTTGAPPGMTLVGSKGGKPVYRDQAGNLHVQEQ